MMQHDINGYVVLVGGKIVAEKYATGRDMNSISPVASVTKSWCSMLIGTLVRDGLVAVNATLGDIWPDAQWSSVQDAEAKRALTLEQLLTMRTGMWEDVPSGGDGEFLLNQTSLVEALNYAHFDANRTGTFNYVNHQLLAYVIN